MNSFIEETANLLPRVVLVACGSFSPPTPMHLRMFEMARDHFDINEKYEVIAGIISPTHDSYGKKGLVEGKHRYAMLKLALRSSNWIRVSDWEMSQEHWTPTEKSCQYFQNYINNYINSPVDDNAIIPNWLPPSLRERKDKVHLKLLCGADLLESFAVPGLWADKDIESILCNYGLVVVSRSGANPEKFIFDSDVLSKYQKNITLITNWVPNEISSTMIRRLLNRGQSIKYLIDDLVLDYITTNGLFNYKSKYINQTERYCANMYNIELKENIVMSSTESTPSPEENICTTDVNSRKPIVFCCRESPNLSVKLNSNCAPGQAVKIVTTCPNATKENLETKSKRMKKAPQYI